MTGAHRARSERPTGPRRPILCTAWQSPPCVDGVQYFQDAFLYVYVDFGTPEQLMAALAGEIFAVRIRAAPCPQLRRYAHSLRFCLPYAPHRYSYRLRCRARTLRRCASGVVGAARAS
jgi:hypothetical protein